MNKIDIMKILIKMPKKIMSNPTLRLKNIFYRVNIINHNIT